MPLTPRQGRLAATAVLLAFGGLLLARLDAFGILDPWELATADQARDIAAGRAGDLPAPPLGHWLVAAGFSAFGIHEWAGRIPIVVSGLLTLVLVYWLGARFAGRAAGAYAVVAAGSTPLFLLNARQMLGQAPAFLAEALVGLSAASAVFLPTSDPAASARRRVVATWLWVAALGGASVLAVLARGAMVGLLPPLAAVAVAAGQSGALRHPDKRRSAAAWAVTGAAVFVVLVVLQAIVADAAEYSHWLGGRPRGGDPPSFEVVLEHVFHAFAPWSALLLVALGRLLVPPAGADSAQSEEPHLRRALILWVAFAYGTLTLLLARYGTGTWIAVAPLALSVGLLLRDLSRGEEPWWPTALVATILIGLLVRDYALYPGSPLGALPIERTEVPEEFNPITQWAAVFGLFAAGALLSFGSRRAPERPALRAPYQLLQRQWRKGWRFRPWLLLLGAVALGVLLLALLSFAAPELLPLTVIVRKWTRRLALGVLLLPAVVAAAQLVWHAVGRLGRARPVPLVLAAVAVAVYVAQGYLPAVSAHYSPRGIYDAYKRLAASGEALGEFRVGSRAAAYYVTGELHELESRQDLLGFLAEAEGERRWAVLPAEDLPKLDRMFRQRTGHHLYVAPADSARVLLVANQPVEGDSNANFLAQSVRDEPPEDIDHPVRADYAGKIELLGYDLELPRDGYVGAGEQFELTWYWRAVREVRGGWQVFVHIDGQGQRLIGDHDPVDGKYPVRLWEKGDVVVDRQTLTVPAHFRPGSYRIMVGFWMGENRLEVVEGPQDGEDRVRAGVLRVR